MKVLVDTSVWIDHLRRSDPLLVRCLQANQIHGDPYIVGELACGNLTQRDLFLGLLGSLPQTRLASHLDVMQLIDAHSLMGQGIGYVDCHLLASVKLAGGFSLWTRDKHLKLAATRLNCAFLES